MKSDIYWIPEAYTGRLAIMPRPRAGEWLEDEILSWRTSGVDIVVSLLTPIEISELGLQNELEVCRANSIEYISYPIGDRQVPTSPTTTLALIKEIHTWLKQDKGVAIHCRMGVGRSALAAACVLVSQGMEADDAFEVIRRARGVRVPDTDEQKIWVARLARDLGIQSSQIK